VSAQRSYVVKGQFLFFVSFYFFMLVCVKKKRNGFAGKAVIVLYVLIAVLLSREGSPKNGVRVYA
jgi:hypothetical protein